MLIHFFNMNLSCKIAPLCNVMRSCLYQKFVFGPKNFTLIQKNLGPNIFLGPEIFFGPKIFKYLGTKNIDLNKLGLRCAKCAKLKLS